jgi:nitrous oxide reductase accessory protein NosL
MDRAFEGTGIGGAMLRILLLVGVTALLVAGVAAYAAEKSPPAPGEKDKCPVCGMFVAKFPDFLSAVRFRDGSYAYFDGPKDLFRYTLGMKRYAPAKRPEDVEEVFVKDYYSLEFIDGRKAFYVTGSDVYGPMGDELVPFRREKDARQFLKDHKGKSLFRFGEITTEVLEGLQ